MSYRGALDLGVVGDRDLVPDPRALIDDAQAELAELRGLLPRQRTQRRTRTTVATKEAPK